MKRELKFRAWGRYGEWDKSGEKRVFQMISGDDLAFVEYNPLCDLLKDKEDQEYFMQFTGLKDRNGIDIYEGDILSGHSDGNVKVSWAENSAHWECVFVDEASIGLDEMCVWFGNPSIVIGNIYENPELIKTPTHD